MKVSMAGREVEDEIAVDGIELPLRPRQRLARLLSLSDSASHRLQHIVIEALYAYRNTLTPQLFKISIFSAVIAGGVVSTDTLLMSNNLRR